MSSTQTTKNLITFMKNQEIKGEKKAVEIMNNGNITEKSITDMLQQGSDEFKKETGRPMTYSEMRSMYG
jgi:basic membrane lipoprotein Med (substrate-binding protein (PBP1-ABC) superfamily)